jgi:hypothetical protein
MSEIKGEEGSLLKYGTGTTATAVGQVMDISWGGIERAAVETTHLTSAGHTFRPSDLLNPGQLTANVLLDSGGTYTTVMGKITTATIENWSITLANGDVWNASAFPTSIDLSGLAVEDNVTYDITLQPSAGTMTITHT